MQVTINGQLTQLSNLQSLSRVVESFGAQPPYALAVNGQFVPKSQHDKYILSDGDAVDILSPVQGG